jgi:hypothetical protein
MAIFGVYRIVEVDCKYRRNFPGVKLHIENPSTGKTFCGKNPMTISQKLFIPFNDCQICYAIAEKKARPLLLKIKGEK